MTIVCIVRVLCWPEFPISLPIWKNKSIWPQRPCCKAMHCLSATTSCLSCWHFSSGWLLASLAGCLCWRSIRFVPFHAVILVIEMKVLTVLSTMNFSDSWSGTFYRACSGYILLFAVLPSAISSSRYAPQGFLSFWCSVDLSMVLH